MAGAPGRCSTRAFLDTYRGVWHSSDGGLLWTHAGNMDEAVLALATFLPRTPLPPKRKKK
jgi:hypothetical protein